MAGIPIESSVFLTGGTARIEGVVTHSQTGHPIPGATVSIRPCNQRWGLTSGEIHGSWRPFYRTEDDGGFRLDGLPEGRYEIEATAPGFLSHRLSPLMDVFGTSHHDRPNAFDILRTHMSAWDEAWPEEFAKQEVIRNHFPKVAEGESKRIAVSLRPGRAVSGHVTDPQGLPVAGAKITATKQYVRVSRGGFDVSDLDSSTTDSQGGFTITVFPGASVEVSAAATGFAMLRTRIESPSEQPVKLVLTPGGRLSGRVTGWNGRILSRVRILAVASHDPENAVTVDSYDGSWSLEGTPSPPLIVIAWHGFGGAAVVQVLDPSIELNLELTPLTTLRGRIVEPTGDPVGDQILWQGLAPEARNRWGHPVEFVQWDIGSMEKTGPDGRFELQVAPTPDGRALIHFDWGTEPAWVDVRSEATLVISEKSAKERKRQAELRAQFGLAERTTVVSPPPVPPKPLPSLTPEEIEKRNRRWIEFLKTAPPDERVQLLSTLRDEACGSNIPDPPRVSDRADLLPVFEAGVDNDDGHTRFWAISCIHYMNRRENLPYLIKTLEHADPHVRGYAIISVESLAKDDESKKLVIDALKGLLMRERQSWDVALRAALALAGLGVKIDPRRFADALKVDGVDHRICVDGLKVLGCKEGIQLILQRFEQADTWNAREYPEALEALTGQKLGRYPQPWREWFEAHREAFPPQWK